MRTIIALFVLIGISSSALGQEIKREITQVSDGIYRFQNRFHMSMFVITGAGVVVSDPINGEAAKWLGAEIAKMTDQPITHLVYSHSDGDHASGGAEYGEVQQVIAQQNAPAAIDGVSPTTRFSDQMSFSQGSKTFELTYLGPGHGHGNDLIAMVVRPDNVAFVVDAVSSKRLPFRNFPDSNVDHWTDQVRVVNALDFDIMIGGHGAIGVKADVAEGVTYLEELRAEVLAGLQAGKSVAQLQQSDMLASYSDWGSYDQWRDLNIEGMARHLREIGAVP
jgi:glyoxylase-like metal-dependent hydrolase (beta-lactamase superfamily II)